MDITVKEFCEKYELNPGIETKKNIGFYSTI